MTQDRFLTEILAEISGYGSLKELKNNYISFSLALFLVKLVLKLISNNMATSYIKDASFLPDSWFSHIWLTRLPHVTSS